jgi:uncharacterized membrane protein YqjE
MRPFLMSPPNSHEVLQPRGEAPRAPLTEIVKETATDLVTLVTAEVKLARLELLAGVRHAMGRAAWLAIGAVPLVTAYLLAVAALAVWLRTVWGWAGSLAATAVAQAIIGGAVLWTLPCSTAAAGPSGSSPSEPMRNSPGDNGARD